jgi:hypothetical protein
MPDSGSSLKDFIYAASGEPSGIAATRFSSAFVTGSAIIAMLAI